MIPFVDPFSSYQTHQSAIHEAIKRVLDLGWYVLDLTVTLPALDETVLNAIHLYLIECDRRNEFLEYLRAHQIGASLHYPLMLHQHVAYADRIRGGDNLPVTDLFYQRNLTLPMYLGLSNNAVEHTISTIQNWFQEKS